MKRTLGILVLLSLLVGGVANAAEEEGRLKILGLSLLFPGLGHRALDCTGRAQAYMAAEAATWGAFAVFQVQGRIRKESYIEMAELFAGVEDARGRSGEYYRRIGRYPNAEYYNDEIRRDARARCGDDLAARADYFERHRVPDDQVWSWVNDDARQRYRDKRSASNGAFQRGGYVIGVAIANRLLAAVDAMRISHSRRTRTSLLLSLQPDLESTEATPFFCVSVRFP